MTLIGSSQNRVRPHHLVADDRCVVDQNVDPALFPFDLIEQRLHLVVVGMVDADGDPLATGRRHQTRRFRGSCPRAKTRRPSRCAR